jgi:type IV pilus assembly protein PilY1
MIASKMKPSIYTLLFFLLTITSGASHADDTEIYFSSGTSGSNAAAIRPNILLILDSSGSMGWTTGTAPKTRMEVMREAMLTIINSMEDVNVGLMRFTSSSGGPVLFPIKYIDDPASVAVSEPNDTNPTITYGISNGLNDGEQQGTAAPVLTETLLEIPSTQTIPGAGTINRTITNRFDDADQFSGTTFTTQYMWMDSAFSDITGARFTDITIPGDATTFSAFYSLHLDQESSGPPDTTIVAEKVVDALAFSDSANDLGTRPRTTANATWDLQNLNVGDTETSPDIGAIVKEVIGQTGWEPGNAINIMTHSSVGGVYRYDSYDTDNANPPALTITYSGGTAVPGTDQVVALRFEDVQVPKGSIITSAKLTVTAKSNSTADGAIWKVSAEKNSTSAALSTTANDFGTASRPRTTANLLWTVPTMASDTPYISCATGTCTGDLSTVVKEVVDQAGWCGGNDLTILIEKSVVGTRKIHSFESDSTLAPKLEITYDSSAGGCYRKTETAQISTNYDDVEEASDGTIQRTSGDMDLSDKKVGLRFQDIDVPKNATILSATLQVNADGTSTANPNPTLEIWGINEANTAQFPSTTDYLTDIAKVDKNIIWALGDFNTDGEWHTSPDIKTIVKDIVDLGTWASGNAMGFVIEDENRNRPAESHDGDPNQSAKLTITYESTAAAATSVTTVRDRLIELVNDIPTSGSTPIVETLYEAARYWRGDSVIYGKSRASSSSTRLSHPGSYCDAASSCNGATVNGTAPVTDAFGVYTPTNCSTTNLTDYDCRTRSIQGTPNYISPFSSTLSCQSNYQVLLTDGEANGNNIADLGDVSFISGSGSCDATGTNRGTFGSGEKCAYDIVEYIHDIDQNSTLDSDQIVTTYTVGFNTTGLTNAKNFLKDVAEAGEGTFNEAVTASDLVSVFTDILSEVKSDPTSFVAPSLATNAFNRLLSRDEVYFGLFTPSYNRSWLGNVKKYSICVNSGGDDEDITTTGDNCTLGNILDQNDVEAIDTTDNKFKNTATSTWSDVVDGRATVKGGSGGEITDYTNQTIFTEATSTTTQPSVGTSLAFANNPGFQIDTSTWNDANLAHVRTAVCPIVSTSANSDCEDRMLWLLGKIIDPDGDTDTSATTRWSVTDVLHSSPNVITYGGSDSDADGVTDTFFDRLVVGTNDGALRFINGTTGLQEWAFYPQSVLGNLQTHFSNPEGGHLYGLDTTPIIRRIDSNGDGSIDPSTDLVHIYAGMRRGGNFLYALDVTPSSTLAANTTSITPKFLWRIEGGTAGFERLNDTWSTPKLATIDTTSGAKDVLIFGGGYDSRVDDGFGTTNTSSTDNMGNAIYVVDPADGSIIFSVTGTCATCTNNANSIQVADMKFAIPSRITVLDTDGDGLDDRLYVGDTGGQVWRVDMADVKTSGTGKFGSTVVGKLASLSTSGTAAAERKFFEPPAVVQVKDTIFSDASSGEYDYVLMGTGDRANPLETAVSNRFYALRDKFIDAMPDTNNDNLADSASYPQTTSGPISHSVTGNLVDVTNTVLDSSNTTHTASLGWYFDFDSSGTDGEKSLSAPTAIAGAVFFTTYSPESTSTDLCSANVGSGAAFNFDILTTQAVKDWDEDGTLEGNNNDDRRKALGGGIPSDVVPIFTKEGVVGIVGIEGGAAQLGTLTGLPRYRTYWYDET